MSKSTAPLTPAMLAALRDAKPGRLSACLYVSGDTHPKTFAGLVVRELITLAGALTPAGVQVHMKANPAPAETAEVTEYAGAHAFRRTVTGRCAFGDCGAGHSSPVHTDRLESPAPQSPKADRYFTHGCGADTLKRDAPEAEAPRFDFAARAAAQAKRDAVLAQEELFLKLMEGQPLPHREPGKALVEELLGGEVDGAMGLSAAVSDAEVAEVLREHSIEKLTPVSPLSVLLRPVRGELVDRATRETFVAVGDVWGVREGYRLRIVCEDSSDMLHGRPLMFMWVGEPQWMLSGDESCDTAWPLLEGTVVQINGWAAYQVQARPGYALPHLVRVN